MGPQREVKVYMSEGLHRQMTQEIVQCGCSATGFIRTAIAKEIVYRRQERELRQPKLPLDVGVIDNENV